MFLTPVGVVKEMLHETFPHENEEERRFKEPVKSSEPDQQECLEVALVQEQRPCLERILTPRAVLVIFTALNFIIYYDRGALSGALASIKGDKDIAGDSKTLTDTKVGFIVSGFMIGYMTTSPLFAAFGGIVPSKWIIVGGMIIWGLACIGTGSATNYATILACRIFVGVGEAAFVGFTVTTIDRIAPSGSRTLWIGTFYSMIPVGTAVGMVVGGTVGSLGTIGPTQGWRIVFFTEVLASIPIVLANAFLPSIYNLRPDSDETEYYSLHKATWLLIKNLNYLLIVFGYAMYSFVLGAFAIWGIPMLIQGAMRLSYMNASLILGGVTALTGVLGSVAGGFVLDKIGGTSGSLNLIRGQLLLIILILLSVIVGITALFLENIVGFTFLLTVSVFALFMVTAPVNGAIMNIVTPELKAYAISYSVFLIHALGDFPSPTFTGFLSDRVFSKGCPLHNITSCDIDTDNQCRWVNNTDDSSSGHCVNEYQLRNALLVVFSMMFLSVPCWLVVYLRLSHAYRRSESLSESSGASLMR
ncbi:transporter, putative,major facilitator superfamily protein (MFS), putative [Trypanosoma cruzi marinkellei]|uniref:Transporter, putative,major facilitator superfamily protein (MFS), putative n=1 Tax=Trypanosoma cruzi marinkellei TaxID=85056 RepID=K2NQX7_TRYCR|nr:transporter, putative,major facilitator superfamily protein (MFS), putative [Trypanosoma cruzi marinkellei]